MKEVRSTVWLDLILVNISENAFSFKKYIEPLEKRWSSFLLKEDYNLIYHAKDYGHFNFLENVIGSLLLKIFVKVIIFHLFIRI